MYSNIRLLDCINRPTALIDKAIELGLSGIAITDHECLSAHMEVNQYAKKIKEKHPDFMIALGNEIYLTDTRDRGQKYYHFLLIAKDAIGHKALREMSTQAWRNSYVDRKMERVPLLKSELVDIMSRYKGHVIATTACIGGELGQEILAAEEAESVRDTETANFHLGKIYDLIVLCKSVFGDDFYLECAPSTKDDQIRVNRRIRKISEALKVKMVVGTDAHYLTKAERPVHKAYLNSKNGEREVDDFYEFAHLMDSDEVVELLNIAFEDVDFVNQILDNTLEIQSKITTYSLENKQMIPKVIVKDYSKGLTKFSNHPILNQLLNSDEIQERYWINECLNSLKEKNLLLREEYLDRLETEADVILNIGEKLNDCLFAYFNTFKHYIDLFWECGSIVGPGRGSSTGFLSNYLLGITQLDPLRWDLPYWRFLNKERAELPDIDIDLAPSKRPAIFKAIRKERGELGLVQVATFGTEGTKSAVLTACRGYRSDACPEGIDIDQAQYMSSLIPQERGFLWPIKEVIYGNEEKGRKPVKQFIHEVNQYPGLLDIIESIEGLVNKRGIHASGAILYGEDPFQTASFMKAPNGELITCYDLHKAEAAGDTKYDFLVTEVSDKIITCFELLQQDEKIEKDLSLRQIYNKYIHPEIMETKDQRLWDHLGAGDVLDVFQFNTGMGLATAKKIKPQNPIEMTAANALIRLMAEPGEELQSDRYARIKENGLNVFTQEMEHWKLTGVQQKVMHKWCDEYWGCALAQETMMQILMDPDIAGFSLADANDARKIVGKKQMNRIPELQQKMFDHMGDQNFANYVWKIAIKPQLGYSFSLNHALPYSFVGIQTLYLAINFNPIYWDTACLIVNSGSLEDDVSNEDIEGEEIEEVRKRVMSTDYGKVAKAIGDIRSKGINVSLANINQSLFGFKPDVENNRILFGLKGMLNVGDDVVDAIIKNRPYISPRDFLNRVKPGKQAMISLIKGGAFDEMMDRKLCMGWYIWETCDKKKRLTLQNMGGLIKHNLLPEHTEEQIMARRIYEFNRYLKAVCKDSAIFYKLDERAINFLTEIGQDDLISDGFKLDQKLWDKRVYQPWMDVFRNWINENKDEILNTLNSKIFKEDWDKYAKGNLSSWEMEVLCFYYHDHELKDVNTEKYGLSDFFALPEAPEVERTFIAKNGSEVNIFKLHKICGTCIAKNKVRSTVTLLTTSGVVEVKFRKEYFSLFDKQISEKGDDGVKHVVEKSWFNRGSMIIVQGFRSGDNFIPKKYASTGGHQLYKIDMILPNGDLILKDARYQGGIEEES